MRESHYRIVTEGAVSVKVAVAEKISKELDVFYNPVMKLNRDITLLLLETLWRERKNTSEDSGAGVETSSSFRVCSPLAGSGVRECRMAVELSKGAVQELSVNDYSADAVRLAKENFKRNAQKLTILKSAVSFSCDEANKHLLDSKGFSYIDIDPFGTPNPFLDASVKRLQRGGILGVTATDTAALAGTYVNPCRRKYWSEPMRNHLMHEVGLRILIRKVQLVAAQYEKALTPIYSYSKDHYVRVFFRNERSKKSVDKALAQHGFMHYCGTCLSVTGGKENTSVCCKKKTRVAGPLWLGELWDATLARAMAETNASWAHGQPGNQRFLETVAREAALTGVLGFYPFNLVRQKLGKAPRAKLELLQWRGVAPTHFLSNAVKAKSAKLLV